MWVMLSLCMEYKLVQMSVTDSLSLAHLKCPIFHDSGAQIRLNLTDRIFCVDIVDRSGACSCTPDLKKLHKKMSNLDKSHDLGGQFTSLPRCWC